MRAARIVRTILCKRERADSFLLMGKRGPWKWPGEARVISPLQRSALEAESVHLSRGRLLSARPSLRHRQLSCDNGHTIDISIIMVDIVCHRGAAGCWSW